LKLLAPEAMFKQLKIIPGFVHVSEKVRNAILQAAA
jgi:hypothetical protein